MHSFVTNAHLVLNNIDYFMRIFRRELGNPLHLRATSQEAENSTNVIAGELEVRDIPYIMARFVSLHGRSILGRRRS